MFRRPILDMISVGIGNKIVQSPVELLGRAQLVGRDLRWALFTSAWPANLRRNLSNEDTRSRVLRTPYAKEILFRLVDIDLPLFRCIKPKVEGISRETMPDDISPAIKRMPIA